MLPITEKAQQEAGEQLSVAGHLARDPGLLDGLLPQSDALWGLARLSLTAEGRQEIAEFAGQLPADSDLLTGLREWDRKLDDIEDRTQAKRFAEDLANQFRTPADEALETLIKLTKLQEQYPDRAPI